MLLKALKSNNAIFYVLIPIVTALFWTKAFLEVKTFPFYKGEADMLLYKPIDYLIDIFPNANNYIAFLFVLLLSFLILKLNIQYSFIRIRSFLPPVLFIVLTSGIPDLHSMHPIYPAALFLILTIDRIFDSFDKERIHSNAFDSGVLLAIGSLFYLNLIFYFPFIWIGFIILKQKVNWREFVLSTIGFLIPWGIAATYYLAADSIDEFKYTIETNFTSHEVFLRENLSIQIYIGYLILLTLIASVFIMGQYDIKKISSRKYFLSFFWIFIISSALIGFSPAVSQEIIIILSIPLTFLISNYLVFLKKIFWGEFLFYTLIAGVIYLQFIS